MICYGQPFTRTRVGQGQMSNLRSCADLLHPTLPAAIHRDFLQAGGRACHPQPQAYLLTKCQSAWILSIDSCA